MKGGARPGAGRPTQKRIVRVGDRCIVNRDDAVVTIATNELIEIVATDGCVIRITFLQPATELIQIVSDDVTQSAR